MLFTNCPLHVGHCSTLLRHSRQKKLATESVLNGIFQNVKTNSTGEPCRGFIKKNIWIHGKTRTTTTIQTDSKKIPDPPNSNWQRTFFRPVVTRNKIYSSYKKITAGQLKSKQQKKNSHSVIKNLFLLGGFSEKREKISNKSTFLVSTFSVI
jgi:hypothetical protein